MSVRLRFALLYNIILAVTLAIFGFSLYSIQAHTTLVNLEKDLVYSSDNLVTTINRIIQIVTSGKNWTYSDPPSLSFETFSDDPEFQSLPEREIVRILDVSGDLVASPSGLASEALPLSENGLAALSQGQEWWEDVMTDQHLLVYNRPLMINGKVQLILQIARPLTERDRMLEMLRNTLITASLITLAIAFWVGWTLGRYTLSPIHRITKTAQEIGNERDFTRRVDYSGPQDEVGQLATTFNGMLTRLEESYQKAAHSLEMQRNFVADVSHELRTPLTTLRGNLELLNHQPTMPAEEQADILKDMTDETDRMIRLVNELLVQARADSAQNLAQEAVELTDLLEEAIRQAHALDNARSISLDAPMELTIVGDRDAIKQVVLILLDNAIKHSSGAIEVTARLEQGTVEISVADHGEGIPEEKLAHVFDRFYRGDNASQNGFGLGLSIAKGLVEGMGGTISMESRVGFGSTVRMRFQAVANPASQDAAPRLA